MVVADGHDDGLHLTTSCCCLLHSTTTQIPFRGAAPGGGGGEQKPARGRGDGMRGQDRMGAKRNKLV